MKEGQVGGRVGVSTVLNTDSSEELLCDPQVFRINQSEWKFDQTKLNFRRTPLSGLEYSKKTEE